MQTSTWILIVLLASHLLGLVSAVHAVMSTRTSQGAIAWIVSLVTIPYIAVPLYVVFGRNKFDAYISARRAMNRESHNLRQRIADKFHPWHTPEADKGEATHAAEALAGLPFLRGNAVEILIDGEATFQNIFRGIDEAEQYVLVQFFIIRDDALGRDLKKRLLEIVAQGVRVYLLYDEVGCHSLPDRYLEELREGGVGVTGFHTHRGRSNRSQINFRNHRKIVIVDGRTAWIGGHNVGIEYLGRDPETGHWRDTHIRIDGPSALAAQLSFVEDWYWATRTMPELCWTPRQSDCGDAQILIVPSSPADPVDTSALMFVQAIHSAKHRIWISSPYFIPDEAVMVALQLAGLRGVDVRILIPDKPDHLLIHLAAFSYFDDAIGSGVKFYRYHDGFLHAKTMLIDESAAAIGTANFDNRSFRLNFEITALFTEPGLLEQMERMFTEDFSKSRAVEADEYSGKPFWFRFAVRLARLTAPIQ